MKTRMRMRQAHVNPTIAISGRAQFTWVANAIQYGSDPRAVGAVCLGCLAISGTLISLSGQQPLAERSAGLAAWLLRAVSRHDATGRRLRLAYVRFHFNITQLSTPTADEVGVCPVPSLRVFPVCRLASMEKRKGRQKEREEKKKQKEKKRGYDGRKAGLGCTWKSARRREME